MVNIMIIEITNKDKFDMVNSVEFEVNTELSKDLKVYGFDGIVTIDSNKSKHGFPFEIHGQHWLNDYKDEFGFIFVA